MPPIGSRRIRGGSGSGGSAIPAYTAMTSDEGDVTALWNFDEASGEFTDSVSSIVLTRTPAPTIATYSNYQIEDGVGGQLANIAPCYTMKQHRLKNAAVTGIDPGTGSVTFELYFRSLEDQTSAYHMECRDSNPTAMFALLFNRTGSLYSYIRATDGSFVQTTSATSYNPHDGNIHHLRVVYDAGSTLKIYLDSVEVTSVSAASLSGKTIEIREIVLGGFTSGGNGSHFYYQARFSNNATNNGYGLV